MDFVSGPCVGIYREEKETMNKVVGIIRPIVWLAIINSNNTPLQQQQETTAATPQDPHPRQQPF